MLTDQEKTLISEAYKLLDTHLAKFVRRPQQHSMITRVASLLGETQIGLIEAPTGIGKSFSYLLPSVILAINRDKRLVVSTATTSLQDQLASKDLPVVLSICEKLGLGTPKFSVAKGRERHVCLTKLDSLTTQEDMFKTDDNAKVFNDLLTLWDSGTWSGQRDHIPGGIKSPIWAKVSNTSASCTGDACPARDDCPYYKTVDLTANARVIVTNHDYLLATLIHVPNSSLSMGEENFYIFDEAHHLGDKCLGAFAKTYDLNSEWQDAFKLVTRMLKISASTIELTLERLNGINRAIEVNALNMLGDGSQHRFVLGEAPASFLTLALQAKGALQELLDIVLDAQANPAQKVKSALSNVIAVKVNGIKGDLNKLIDCLESFIDDDTPRARWLTRHRSGVELRCSPFDPSSVARQHLWPKLEAAVLTSATLSSLGKFDSVLRSLGLPSDTRCLKLDSPLDYSQASLVVPNLALEATDKGHHSSVCAFVRRTAFQDENRLGVLIYFTSKSNMLKVYAHLTDLEKTMVLIQKDMHPSAMVAIHRERISRGQKSVLFGLDSLSEGLDLPGLNCTRVIIDKLPFPSTDDPIMATHAEHLKKKGFEPFSLLTLPKTGQKLAQIVGRLIRSEGDFGEVIVLDKRMVTRSYGSKLLASTPFAKIASAY
jgi:ATP-dependent DNA helicase DinG